MNSRLRIATLREVLLVEIERRCAHADCQARVRLGLTKQEAREYHGFDCEHCERWTEDVLTERDVPEWWEEISLVTLGDAREEIMGSVFGSDSSGRDELS